MGAFTARVNGARPLQAALPWHLLRWLPAARPRPSVCADMFSNLGSIITSCQNGAVKIEWSSSSAWFRPHSPRRGFVL